MVWLLCFSVSSVPSSVVISLPGGEEMVACFLQAVYLYVHILWFHVFLLFLLMQKGSLPLDAEGLRYLFVTLPVDRFIDFHADFLTTATYNQSS